MSITRSYPTSWGVGDKLTSAQQNALDINTTYGLDRRAAQTDTLESVVSTSGAGRMVEPVVLGANANTTYYASGANRQIAIDSSVTANRIYTLGQTNALPGDRIRIWSLPTIAFQVTVQDSTVPTTLALIGPGTSGQVGWAEFVYQNSAWRLAESGQPVTTSKALFATAMATDWSYGGGGYLVSSSSSTYAEATALAVTLTGAVGDKLVISSVVESDKSNNTTSNQQKIMVNDGGTDIDVAGSEIQNRLIVGADGGVVSIPGVVYSVANAGSVVVKYFIRRTAGAGTCTVYAGTMSVQQYR